MKKTVRNIIICLLVVGTLLAFVACSEKTDRKPVETNVNGATVTDNGGMAVKYGNYIYFINGFAGESASNSFGDVIRGAICRTTLRNGVPDYTTTEIIVPKNVFGEDKTYGGLYILDGYIYYNTTSVDKDSDRKYKSDEGVLMRTSIDGSKTEIVREADDNDVVIYAGNDSKYLALIEDNYIYTVSTENKSINLLTKPNAKKPTEDKQTAIAYKVGGDYIVYTMYNYADEANYSKDYIVWACNLKTGENTKILSSEIYNKNTNSDILYTTTLLNVIPNADGFTLYYSVTGNDIGINNGFYSYNFNADNPSYDSTKKVRYTYETSVNAYTAFYRLANGDTLAFNKKLIDVFKVNGTKATNADLSLMRFNFEKEITLIDVIETDTEVYAYYLLDSKFYYIKLFNKENNGYISADENAVCIFSGKYNSSYVSYDIIDNIIYYLEDEKEDNAYYYAIPDINTITADTDTANGKILGIITKEDMVKLLEKETEDSKES